MTIQQLLIFLHSDTLTTLILVPLALILLDFISGIGSALKQKTFSFLTLGKIFGQNFVWYIICLLIVSGCYIYSGESSATPTQIATWIGFPVLSLSIFASVIQNLSEISPALAQIVEQAGTLVGLKTPTVTPIEPVSGLGAVSVPGTVVEQYQAVYQNQEEPAPAASVPVVPVVPAVEKPEPGTDPSVSL